MCLPLHSIGSQPLIEIDTGTPTHHFSQGEHDERLKAIGEVIRSTFGQKS